MKHFAGPLLTSALFAMPQIGLAFEATNGMVVNQINASVFEVIPRDSGAGGLQYWCAASDFAEVELHAKWEDQIYVVRGPGPAETMDRDLAVQFTLDPAAAGVTPGPLSEDENEFNVGGHMEMSLAHEYCRN